MTFVQRWNLLRVEIKIHMPELSDLVKNCETEMTVMITNSRYCPSPHQPVKLISVNWLLTLLASCFEPRTLYRVWDHLFTSGSVTLFQVS